MEHALPGVKMRDETVCPKCGRYVGPLTVCPYCGAKVPKRLSVKVLRIASLVMATGGLFGLWVYAAFFVQSPVVQIGDLGITYNFAHIRIHGNISQVPYYDETTGKLRFTVSDGTGELNVNAYSNIALELINEGNVPAPGDEVEVEGTLRIRTNYRYLILNSAKQLKIYKKPIENVTIMELHSSWKNYMYARIRVSAVFGEIKRGETTWNIDAYDPNNASEDPITVYFSLSYIGIVGGYDRLPTFEGGTIVTFEATVLEYNDEPEIVPRSFENANVTLVPKYKISDILSSVPDGTLVRIDGTVSSLVSSTITGADGVKFNVNDGSGNVEVICWDDYTLNLTNKIPAYGDNVSIVGVRDTYAGTVQIKALGEATIILSRETVNVENITRVASISSGSYIHVLNATINSIDQYEFDTVIDLSTGGLNIFAFVNDSIQILTGPISRLNLEDGDNIELYGNLYYNGSAYIIYISRTQNIKEVVSQ